MSAGETSKSTPNANQLRTVVDVAKRLRVSKMTIYRLIRAGELPAVMVGRGYRISDKDVQRYLESRYMDAG